VVNQREQIKISLSLSLSLSLSPGLSPTDPECVFITAVPIIKLFAWGEGDSASLQVFINDGARILCTSDGVCVIIYV
jgi:hypothetical protein